MSLIDDFAARLRGRGLKPALPESEDERVLRAAARLAGRDLARPVLIGERAEIEARAKTLGASLADCDIRSPSSDPGLEKLAGALAAARPSLNVQTAARLLRKPHYFAGALVAAGEADALIAGAATPTRRIIEAGLMTIGAAPGVASPSSCFLMLVKNRPLIFADCAVIAEPTARELADIAIASAASCQRLLGERPRIALLSFSTHGSAQHPSIDKIREALAMVRAERPDLAIDGELQADAALSAAVAARKVKSSSDVAGRANVLVFPDLNSGNIAYKLVQQLAGAEAIGPLLQGFAKPVSDLSRGASVEDIVAATILTLTQGD